MLTRKDIVDCEMLHDLKIIGNFNCKDWECINCPLHTTNDHCIPADIQDMLDKYEDGEEVIY